MDQWNRDVWRIPGFVAPGVRGALKEMGIIEVDPEYISVDDHLFI